jgi:hypothetical protein
MMHHVPQAGLTALAVAGPVERGVRRLRAHWIDRRPTWGDSGGAGRWS